MPEQVRCPSCNAALRIPDHLIGKNVKCPKCQQTFVAETEELDELEEVAPEPPAPAARRRPRPPEDREEEEPPPEEEFEEEEEERPRRRRGRGRRIAQAQSAVAGPAISLIVLGGLDIFLVLVSMVLGLAGVNFVPGGAKGAGGPGGNFDFLNRPAAAIPGNILSLCFAATILMGGIKMKQLQNHGLAVAASILAILPCGNPCCCVGIFLGIWSLTVVNRPDVKNAFS